MGGEEKEKRGSRVVKRRSKIIRRKTFKTRMSSNDVSSPDFQALTNPLYLSSKMRARTYQITSDCIVLLLAFRCVYHVRNFEIKSGDDTSLLLCGNYFDLKVTHMIHTPVVECALE